METIYISIPSIWDTETVKTVENIYKSAEFPERVFVGVSFLDKKDTEFLKVKKMSESNSNISAQFNKLNLKDIDTLGTGNGRSRAFSMYKDQDFYLQIDSHTLFLNKWDTTLINSFYEFKEEYGSDSFVLTGYLSEYEYTKNGDRVPLCGKLHYPFFDINDFYLKEIPAWSAADISEDIKEKFLPCVKFNGNFAFGNKTFINNMGALKEAIFYDEEMVQTFNLIKNGIEMVFPNIDNFPLYHLYSDYINEYGGERTYFMELVDKKYAKEMSDRSRDNYVNYIKDESNRDIIKKYEKYARINVTKGAITEKYIPKKFMKEVVL